MAYNLPLSQLPKTKNYRKKTVLICLFYKEYSLSVFQMSFEFVSQEICDIGLQHTASIKNSLTLQLLNFRR